jgi:preprotein translocase subunit SecA
MFEPEEAPRGVEYSGGGETQPSALADARTQAAAAATGAATSAAAAATGGGDENGQTPATPSGTHRDSTTGAVVKDEHAKVGRNDPCWCGSGKKYKKCHGA